jgi:hypothetical protein
LVKRCGKQLQQPQQKQRSSNNQSSSRAAYSRSRAAGRPCEQVAKSCQALEIYYVFELGFPWCFPVREVRLFKAICWLKDVASSCSSRSRSSAAATTKVAAEQLTAGAG